MILLTPTASAFMLKLNIYNQKNIIKRNFNSKAKCVRDKNCDFCAFQGMCSKVGDSRC